jgi:hypothetical protein
LAGWYLLWRLLDHRLEQITHAFHLLPAVTLDELGDVEDPDVVQSWPSEDRESGLECLETLLEVGVLFEQLSEIDHNEGRDHFQLEHTLVGCPQSGERTKTLLQVEVELPECERIRDLVSSLGSGEVSGTVFSCPGSFF